MTYFMGQNCQPKMYVIGVFKPAEPHNLWDACVNSKRRNVNEGRHPTTMQQVRLSISTVWSNHVSIWHRCYQLLVNLELSATPNSRI